MPDLDKDLQPTAQEDAPVVIDQRPQTVAVDRNQLDTTPQVVDGRVKVSDDISAQAEEQGYEPDIQPRAAVPGAVVTTGVGDSGGSGLAAGQVLPDTTAGQIQGLRAAGKDSEADELAVKSVATKLAADVIAAPLSIKSELAAQVAVDNGDVTLEDAQSQPFEPSSAPDVNKAPESMGAVPLEQQADATVLAQPNPGETYTQPVEQTDPTAPGNPDDPAAAPDLPPISPQS